MTERRIEKTFRAEHPRLWRSLVAFCGDPNIASDAESEAFTQALGRSDHIEDPKAWIWRSAFRIASGMLKQRNATAPIDTNGSQILERTASLVSNGVAHEDQRDSERDVLDMLGGLSEQQRRCVALRYIGGFKPSEIAVVLEASPETVRVQLHRAHAALRSQIDRQREEQRNAQ